MDEVFVRIRGKLHYLWPAVDQDGHVLDILLQSRRNAKAAKRFFRKLLKNLQYVPSVIVTDKLKSYAAAKTSNPVRRRAPTEPLSQQSCRGVTPVHATTRTAYEALQVGSSGAAFPLGSQSDP
jgi:transposase-like protein